MVFVSFKNLQEKTSVYILKPCQKIRQSFEESLQGVLRTKKIFFEE